METRVSNQDDKQVTAIRRAVSEQLDQIQWGVRHHETGQVTRTGDGVAHVQGLPSARYGELVQTVAGHPVAGITGITFDIRPNELGVLFLDPSDPVSAGDELLSIGRVASVVVGTDLLGRVVDVLGRPLDGGPPIRSTELRPMEREAPGVADRFPVREPLHTGTKLIDALLPIGRGQRELILGDRSTGKTALALDAILAQRESGVVCVYAALGQRKSAVAEVVATLRAHGALDHTIVVSADADSPPGQQYLAPYAACSIAEYFMEQGHHALIVYDSLTAHADVYRRVALLFERPPGREAYPADVFYLHARLLERATRLKDDLGGGSLTALPLADTQGGSISAYIPTNLISITDGQIILDSHLFNEGFRPAVDVGLSVSRVGGKAQPPLLRGLSGDLRLVYAQLGELETFARFGAELEPEARARLERGRRLREALKQGRLAPLSLLAEVATLFAIREGYLDSISVIRVSAFLEDLYQAVGTLPTDLAASIETDTSLSAELEARLRSCLTTVQHRYVEGEMT
jgi:F-type H+/Na+-transporting ATPase subunit alpha